MSAADVAIGMMDGAYFTSRNELLTFFNTLLNLNLTKIEQTASGAVACQLTEYLFPGSIPMSKVNWSAKSSHEYVGNYKLLQKAFTKNKVQRYVDVDKLIRGKYQDNLEFCQWLKAFFDMQNGGGNAGREDYDPVAVRAKGKGGKTVPAGGGAGKARGAPVRTSSSVSSSSGGRKAPVVGKARIGSSAATTTTSSATARAAPSPRRMASSSSATTSTTSSAARSSRPGRERPVSTQKENTSATNLPTTSRKSTTPAAATSSTTYSSTTSNVRFQQYQEEITTLKSQNSTLQTQFSQLQLLSTELEMNLSTVETERDFYFEKLRGIEVMLQVYKEQEEERGDSDGEMMKRVIDKIFKVMYAAAEDNVVVDDDGNIVGDITIDESIVQNNVSCGSIRPHAQDELVNDDEDDDEDELLTSGIVEPVETPVAVEEQLADVAPLSEDDDDDDELLTEGIISPVNEEALTSDAVDTSANQHLQPELDDDDDELLTSGIDSGDEAVVEDDATNRSAENARIISQLVGDDNNDAEEDLLVDDDASQDEY